MVEPAVPAERVRVARWRYVVPNAVTCTSLLLGLAAIVLSFQGDHGGAAWLVVLCVLLDKADGTVARALNATSRIGLQLDSFSDFVTFGIAPAYILYAVMLHDPAGAGDIWAGGAAQWGLYALLGGYVLCAVIRLAKFNVLEETLPADGPKVFYGLPSTFSGGLLVITYLIGEKYGWVGLVRWMPIIAAFLGALMVSNFPLPKLGKRKAMWLNVFTIVNVAFGYVCGILRILPEYIFGAVLLYAIVGFSWGFIHRRELAPRNLDPYAVAPPRQRKKRWRKGIRALRLRR